MKILPYFNKHPEGIIPVIIQDDNTLQVLLLGYMNNAAYCDSVYKKKVTFFSRTKKRLWTKGEKSSNFLLIKEIKIDCDGDTLLIKAQPTGPICHKGSYNCWGEEYLICYQFFKKLENTISYRKKQQAKYSYIYELFKHGINKIIKKLGEELIELIIEAKDKNNKELFLNEAADLLFHYIILLNAKNNTLEEVICILQKRHKPLT